MLFEGCTGRGPLRQPGKDKQANAEAEEELVWRVRSGWLSVLRLPGHTRRRGEARRWCREQVESERGLRQAAAVPESDSVRMSRRRDSLEVHMRCRAAWRLRLWL